jgi:hypothetical protein
MSEKNMNNIVGLEVIGFLKIHDPQSGQVLLEKKNAIHYENISEALAFTLSNRGMGTIYQMAFGNGGASVDATGIITYLPPNTTGQNSSLYNQTYAKIVDDTLVSNTDVESNKMNVNHASGKVYSDILVQCLLGYSEPSGQEAFDNGSSTTGDYVFDEIGLLANYGQDENGEVVTKLITHVIFHPIQKALNRQIQVDYTIRIQTLTSVVTV